MSGEKTIATLVGKLRFDVDTSGLLKFQQLLDKVDRQMSALGLKATQLQKKLGIAPKGSTSFQKQLTNNAKQTNAEFQNMLRTSKLQLVTEQQSLKLQTAQQRLAQQEARTGQAQASQAHKAELERAKTLNAQRTFGLRQEQQSLKLQQEKLRLAATGGPTGASKQRSGAMTTKTQLGREYRLERALSSAKKDTFKQELAGQKLQFTGHKAGESYNSAALKSLKELAIVQEKNSKALQSSLKAQGIEQKDTFKQSLANQKLQFAGHKADSKHNSASIKSAKQLASLQERQSRALHARLKSQGIENKNSTTLAQAKTRQARLEALLTAQQHRTNAAKQLELKSMTSLQRAEVQLQQLRAAGARKVQQYAERRAAQQQTQAKRSASLDMTEQRRTEKHNQSQQRFQWAQQRQQRWAAQQASKDTNVGVGAGFDIMSAARAHPIVAGLAGVATAFYTVEARIQSTTDRVSQSEQYENVLDQAGGKNADNKKFAREEFNRISEKYGTSVDMESAKDFRTNIMTATAGGKLSLEAAIKQYETQQAAFRGAGMNREEQARALIQLRQVRAKGVGDTEDFKTFLEAAPLLGEEIGKAWAERTGFKGKPEDIQGAVLKDIPKGGLLAKDFNNAMSSFVKNNQAAIDKQSASIDAAKTRAENAKFLQQQGIDQSTELKAAIHERIKAEHELTKAMQPVNEAMAKFDTALIQASASLLNFYFKPQNVQELEEDVTAKQKRLDTLPKGLAEGHPARLIAEKELKDAQAKLTEAKLKAGSPFPKAPAYLLKDAEQRNVLPDNIQRAMQGLTEISKPQQLSMIPTTSNTINDNRQVTISKIEVNGSNLTANEIATSLESKIQSIAAGAFRDGISREFNTAKTNLVETKK